MPSMFWNPPAIASTLPERSAGTRLNPTVTRCAESGESPPDCSIVFTYAVVEALPSTPIVLPSRSPIEWMPRSVRAMIEFSAVGTSAATATTGMCFCAAKNTSGSYDTPRSARPAATSLIGSDTSDGVCGSTSNPARANWPWSIAV